MKISKNDMQRARIRNAIKVGRESYKDNDLNGPEKKVVKQEGLGTKLFKINQKKRKQFEKSYF